MNLRSALRREISFALRERAFVAWTFIVLLLSSISVGSGLAEIEQQNITIKQLQEADESDRTAVLAQQQDWGDAAYYSFHLTFAAPSDFAFAAIGLRDTVPWKHRIRMLALEGQIHESDTGNPEFALISRFDFAFLAVFVLPLVIIVLLHDLQARERAAGRHDLLTATAGSASSLWIVRGAVRVAIIFLCLTGPLTCAALISETALSTLAAALFALLAYTVFWTFMCLWFSHWRESAPVVLTGLIGVWVLLALVIPAGGRTVVDQLVPIPSGAEIIMTQREAVNDAWDLPKAVTMQAFAEQHPQWAAYTDIKLPFEWKWYYAFQQVGDQKTEALSSAYQEGRLLRDEMASWIALFAPPALLERHLQSLAATDVHSAVIYENRVRQFHAELRNFFYPRLFRGDPFDAAALKDLPRSHGIALAQ